MNGSSEVLVKARANHIINGNYNIDASKGEEAIIVKTNDNFTVTHHEHKPCSVGGKGEEQCYIDYVREYDYKEQFHQRLTD